LEVGGWRCGDYCSRDIVAGDLLAFLEGRVKLGPVQFIGARADAVYADEMLVCSFCGGWNGVIWGEHQTGFLEGGLQEGAHCFWKRHLVKAGFVLLVLFSRCHCQLSMVLWEEEYDALYNLKSVRTSSAVTIPALPVKYEFR
jgi:hypothetical protein